MGVLVLLAVVLVPLVMLVGLLGPRGFVRRCDELLGAFVRKIAGTRDDDSR